MRFSRGMLLQGMLALLAVVAFAGDAEARRAPLVDPDPVAIPAGLTAAQVAADVKRALVGRGWEIVSEQPGQIESTLHLREHVATISVSYDDRQVRFAYVDSSNLDYRVKRGEPQIHSNYLGWIGYLVDDLATNLQVSAAL